MLVKDCALIEPFICNEDEHMLDVAKKLRSTTLRHIFVVDKNNYPTGIISVIDVNNRLVAEGKDPRKTTAKEIMSKPVDVVKAEDDLNKVCDSMVQKQRVMNAVVKDNRMFGILTLHQAMKAK